MAQIEHARPLHPEERVYEGEDRYQREVNEILSLKGQKCAFEDVSDGGISRVGLTDYGFWYLAAIAMRELTNSEADEDADFRKSESFEFFTHIYTDLDLSILRRRVKLFSQAERQDICNVLTEYIESREDSFPWKDWILSIRSAWLDEVLDK